MQPQRPPRSPLGSEIIFHGQIRKVTMAAHFSRISLLDGGAANEALPARPLALSLPPDKKCTHGRHIYRNNRMPLPPQKELGPLCACAVPWSRATLTDDEKSSLISVPLSLSVSVSEKWRGSLRRRTRQPRWAILGGRTRRGRWRKRRTLGQP